MGDFLTADGLKTLAVDYQQSLLDRLNDEIDAAGIKQDVIIDLLAQRPRFAI